VEELTAEMNIDPIGRKKERFGNCQHGKVPTLVQHVMKTRSPHYQNPQLQRGGLREKETQGMRIEDPREGAGKGRLRRGLYLVARHNETAIGRA